MVIEIIMVIIIILMVHCVPDIIVLFMEYFFLIFTLWDWDYDFILQMRKLKHKEC